MVVEADRLRCSVESVDKLNNIQRSRCVKDELDSKQKGDTTMKRMNLMLLTLFAALLTAGSVFAQDKKMDMPKDRMDMAKMHADGHHALMMAYHHNAVAFTRILWEMTADGKIEDISLARAAFAEIKESLERMDEIHKMHMSKMAPMDAAMMEKMKPMMEKMETEKAALMGHVLALGNGLQAGSPSAHETEMHAAVLLLKLEKMATNAKRMEM